MIKDPVTVFENYGYNPSLGGNATGLTLAALLLIVQTGLGLWYRQWWMLITWFIGIAWTLIGYGTRTAAALGYYNNTAFDLQYVFFIIIPAFIMAGVYYQMTKLLTIWGPQFAYFKPMFYTGTFIGSDVLSILVQAAGGGVATSKNPSQGNIGRWIVLAGIIIQLISMAWFLVLFTQLVLKTRKQPEEAFVPQYAYIRAKPSFKYLVPAIYVCWVFVYIRSIYRLAETAQGFNGYMATHERYFLVLEGLMMMIAMWTLTILYPGYIYGRAPIRIVGLHAKGGRKWTPLSLFKKKKTQSDESMDEKELVEINP